MFLGTGFRDTTRLASGSPSMWRDIALTNAEAIARSIDDLHAELEQLKTALGAKDAAALEKFFAEGKSGRDEWLASWEKK
jgi:prephenate dehydrogenase